MENLKELKVKIEKVLNQKLPSTAWRKVSIYKILNDESIAIEFAGSDYLINNVKGQRPLAASLRLDKNLELKPQIFGGSGGRDIYFSPDKENPKEKYLALGRTRLPFRTPKKEEKKVLESIGRFVDNWIKAIKEKDSKFYRFTDKVDYSNLKGEKEVKNKVKNMANKKVMKLGFGTLGNGITVWNSNVMENGDYKKVAHISNKGEINYYMKRIPSDAKYKIEAQAKAVKEQIKEFKKQDLKSTKKNTVSRKRKAPLKKNVAKKVDEKPVKKANRVRLSTSQKLSSGKDNLILTGCVELASKCLRKGKSGSEEKKILNQTGKIRTALAASPDKSKVDEFKKMLKNNDQKLYKDLVNCKNSLVVGKFFKDCSLAFKSSTKKQMPENLNW